VASATSLSVPQNYNALDYETSMNPFNISNIEFCMDGGGVISEGTIMRRGIQWITN
jgi:hypothetical protein